MNFTDFIKTVCVLSLSCTLMYSLLPGNKSDKPIKLIISAFFLVTVFAPISQLIADAEGFMGNIFTATSKAESDFSSVLDKKVVDATSAEMEDLISKKLDDIGINRHTVSVYMETDADNVLRFKHVQVVVDYPYVLMLPAAEETVLSVTDGEGIVDVYADNLQIY